MLDRLHVLRASWTLIDQGLVSAGAFLINVQLARQFAADEYGTFALLFGGFLALQIVNSALLLYPMSIRLPVMPEAGKKQLQSTTAILVAGFSIPLAAVVAVMLFVFGHTELIPPAVAAFLCWQIQEAMRRGLLAEFRYGAAIIGDATAYYGQVVAIAALSATGTLTLAHVFEVMAAGYAAGAIIQAIQNGFSLRHVANLTQTIRDFCAIGSWSLLNNAVSVLRIQILPWTLAAAGGPAAAASFQAAMNVVNLANPVILGLCNVIPQTAARAHQSGGNAGAWRAARVYIFMGIPPILGYYGLVVLAPALFLRIFYGANSPYLALTLDLQILAVAWAISYATEMTCAYLHGVSGARLALVINTYGAITAAVMALPLIHTYGLMAGCFALLGANLVRLAVSYHIQRRITADDYITA